MGNDLSAAPVQAEVERDTLSLLRADIAKRFEADGNARCDDCGAPLFDDDQTTTDIDEVVALCAGHRDPAEPIYSYRVAFLPTTEATGAGEREAYERAAQVAKVEADRLAARMPMGSHSESACRSIEIAIRALATPRPSAPGEGLREALDKALYLAVCTLAFHGRDRGTDRQERMLNDLEDLAREVDPLIREARNALTAGGSR